MSPEKFGKVSSAALAPRARPRAGLFRIHLHSAAGNCDKRLRWRLGFGVNISHAEIRAHLVGRLKAEFVAEPLESAPGHRPRHAVVAHHQGRAARRNAILDLPGCGTSRAIDLRMIDRHQAGCGSCPSSTDSSIIAW
jgi:hypothetical protein